MAIDPIARLVKELALLPGIGERTALRLALHLLGQKKDQLTRLADSLIEVAHNVVECKNCCNLTAYSDQCVICLKPGRDERILCVVACIQDLMAIEASNSFRGLYHVLHGVLEPINGIGPRQLRISELSMRRSPKLEEIILATPATVEGEATALFIREQAQLKGLKFSRIASGIPVGGDLQFADRLSLARALIMRQDLSS